MPRVNLRELVFVIKPRGIRASVLKGAQWHRLVLAALAAGGVGVLSWVTLFPAASVVPAADSVSPRGLTAHAPARAPGAGSGQAFASPLPSGAAPPGYSSAPPRSYAPPSGGPQGTPAAAAASGTGPS